MHFNLNFVLFLKQSWWTEYETSEFVGRLKKLDYYTKIV